MPSDPLIENDTEEPIEAVLARLAHVDLLTLTGCERWLIDAQRALGWMTLTRLRVERAQWELAWANEPAADADRVPDPEGSTPQVDELEPAAEPPPSPDAPARTSRRREARDRELKQAIDLLPSFGRTLERGELTEDHVLAVDAIRNRDAARVEETAILAAAMARTAEDFAAWLCSWDAFIDLERHGDLTARQRAARKLQLFDRPNEFRGTLAPADFDAFKRTLQDIDADLSRRRAPDERITYDQRMADALIEMMHRARGATTASSGDGSLRTAVVVLIDLKDLLGGTGHGVTPNGSPVDVGEARRMAATGHVIPVVLGADSVPLDMGRARRYADDTQWLALLARDGGCVLCDAPLGTLDAHHTPHWHKGGTTDLCTMCLCCTRCHRRIHAEKITLTFTNGRIRAHMPDGTPVTTRSRLDRRAGASRPGAPPGTDRAA